MRTPTIYDIKYQVKEESLYFSRGAMRFFGQTLRDFHVRQSPTGRIFIYAPLYCRTEPYNKRRLVGYTFREFVKGDLIHPTLDNGTLAIHDTISQISEFINTH